MGLSLKSIPNRKTAWGYELLANASYTTKCYLQGVNPGKPDSLLQTPHTDNPETYVPYLYEET